VGSWADLAALPDTELLALSRRGGALERQLRKLRGQAQLVVELRLQPHEAALLLYAGIASSRGLAQASPQQLLTQPKILELFTDPAVAGAASEGNYFSLLTSPKLAEVASDPEVQKFFTGFDLEKALDYALQESAPSPVPTP
jgi:hypothetical protein